MVFASLTQKDKEALFSLLDEYFESRPELFQRLQDASASSPPPNQSSHPPRPLSPSRMAGAIQNGARSLLKGRSVPPALSASPSTSTLASGPPAIPARQPTPRIVEPEERHEEVDEAPVSVSSRIAAAQAAIGTGFTGKPPVPTTRKPSAGAAAKPSPPPRSFRPSPETSPAASTINSPPPPPRSPSANSTSSQPQPTTASLVQSRSFGTIDTSSAGSAASTIWSFKGVGKNEKKPTGAHLPNQSAFEKPKTRDLFAPPPTRRDTNGSVGSSPTPTQAVAIHQQEEEEEQQGEWVVALYDFASSEPTDLSFKEGDQIWVTERTSKDWWMAELQGNSGLVPSAYVKLLY